MSTHLVFYKVQRPHAIAMIMLNFSSFPSEEDGGI